MTYRQTACAVVAFWMVVVACQNEFPQLFEMTSPSVSEGFSSCGFRVPVSTAEIFTGFAALASFWWLFLLSCFKNKRAPVLLSGFGLLVWIASFTYQVPTAWHCSTLAGITVFFVIEGSVMCVYLQHLYRWVPVSYPPSG